MARAIVRYSCNNTAGKYAAGDARAGMRKCLQDAGFERVGVAGKGTASWELRGDAITTAQIAGALACVLEVVEGLAPGVLDHLWIYCDE
jgi:hypothetical protein